MNLRVDHTFVEDEGWHIAAGRYQGLYPPPSGAANPLFELGVGENTPVIIKYQFWEMTYQNPNAVYACINLSGAHCPTEIRGQSICIDGDIQNVLNKLVKCSN